MKVQSGYSKPSQAAGLPADLPLVSRPINWLQLQDGDHFVQLYEAEAFMLDSAADFFIAGFSRGDAGIVILTEARLQGLEQRFEQRGVDLKSLVATGQLICFPAEDVLQDLHSNGISSERLTAVFDATLASAGEGGRIVRVFGEVVNLLWAEGNVQGAIQLERLWTELQKLRPCLVFCAYPISSLGKQSLVTPLTEVCAAHSLVIPSESYTALNDSDERLRAVALLQQRARALEAEIVEHSKTEERLQLVKEELETQVEDLRRLHEISLRLTSTLEIDSVLKEVLKASLEAQGTNMGLLSMVTPEEDGLKVKYSSGFRDDFLKQIQFIPIGAGGCGAALQRKQRVVIENVELDPVTIPYVEAARRAGFRAVHCTPLITREGVIIGILSAYFSDSRAPTEREKRFMDLY